MEFLEAFLTNWWKWLMYGWCALVLIGLFVPVRRFLSRWKKAEWLVTHRHLDYGEPWSRKWRSRIVEEPPTINFDDPNWRDQIKAVYGDEEDGNG